jgi:class 3 adenylate cyclase/tetratricopeptide (TPR) repeat protein/energy-coupling factor transporter ATP-binding protein EcfA2
MTFDDILEQVITLLKRQGRVSYRALKVRFSINDEYLEALKEEILYVHASVIEADDRGFIWTGETEGAPEPASQPDQTTQQPTTQQDQPIQLEAPPPEPPTPDAERRQLTVMFCDLADSTKLSGQLDPEDLRDVIRAYQETAAGVIQRYDGHIAQYLGDGLLVYFGWPQAHEDDAQRGVHAGLGIVEAMRDLNTRLEKDKGVRLAVRIGIHTGPVVIGEMGGGGRHERLALGETTNIAARLEGLAQPNTVVISDTTYRLVEGYFRCDDLGMHTLKGVATPIQTYQVLQATGVHGRLDAAMTHGLTPLVGREQETGLLFARWTQVKDGQGQVILLSGEAGIGKSRLVQVLKGHVAEGTHTSLECRSSSYYQNTALYPITDLLQRTLQWQQDETPEGKLTKLEQMLSQYQLPLEETVPLFTTLLSLPLPEDRYPPLPWTPQRQRQKTLETIVAILLQQAEQQPVLFILEDLHWTDPTTLELPDVLMDQVPTALLLTLLTCRPEFTPPWGLRSHLTPIALNRFTRSQIETMVEQVTDGKSLPGEVMQHLVEKTDGVPLYIEEMTKAILESGVLQATNGDYELAGPLSSLSIPATLQDSLMARLDRLGTAKGIAQLGAALGRTFTYELIQAVSSLDEKVVERSLVELVQAELLYQRGSLPHATFTFKHALIQDAAYQSLLRSTRQQYHQQIAQVLETQFPETVETQPELVAHHYTEADCHQEAVVYWQRAGERASAGSAYVEAVAHFQQGLDILPPLPETAKRAERELALQLGLGTSLIVSQGWTAPEVEHAYVRAYELCQQLREPPSFIPVLQGLRRLYALRGDRGAIHKARELGEQLLALAQLQNDPVLLQEAHWALGQTLYFLGDLNAARSHLEQSSAFYTPQPLVSQASRDQAGTQIACLFFTDLVLWMLGYPDQALRICHDGLALAHELSHPFTLAFAFEYVALTHQFRREVQATRQQTEAMITLANEQGFPVFTSFGTFLRAWVLAMEGDRQEAITQIQQAMATLRDGIDNAERALHSARLVEAYGVVGQTEEGLRSVAEALEFIEKTDFRVYEPEPHRVQGELLLQQTGSDTSQV